MILNSYSSEETEIIGEIIGSLLPKGSIVALYGDLGGGKTCLTRGIVKGIAPQSAELVSSPTYSIMNEYLGITTVYHFDFYRLSGIDEIFELGFDNYFYGNGICIIEWSERINDILPPETIKISFEYITENQRTIRIEETSGPKIAQFLDFLKTTLEKQKKL